MKKNKIISKKSQSLLGGIYLTICSVITKAQTADCTNINTNGCEPVIWLANKSDIISLTSSANVVTAITMDTAKKFYAFESTRTAVNTKQTTKSGKLRTTFIHEVSTNISNSVGDTKTELENLCNGSIVAIVENKFKGASGASAFEIFGYDQGLIGELTRDQSNQDASGGYELTLKTPDGYTEPKLPRALFITSLAATRAVITALL